MLVTTPPTYMVTNPPTQRKKHLLTLLRSEQYTQETTQPIQPTTKKNKKKFLKGWGGQKREKYGGVGTL